MRSFTHPPNHSSPQFITNHANISHCDTMGSRTTTTASNTTTTTTTPTVLSATMSWRQQFKLCLKFECASLLFFLYGTIYIFKFFLLPPPPPLLFLISQINQLFFFLLFICSINLNQFIYLIIFNHIRTFL
mgnify:FL=1